MPGRRAPSQCGLQTRTPARPRPVSAIVLAAAVLHVLALTAFGIGAQQGEFRCLGGLLLGEIEPVEVPRRAAGSRRRRPRLPRAPGPRVAARPPRTRALSLQHRRAGRAAGHLAAASISLDHPAPRCRPGSGVHVPERRVAGDERLVDWRRWRFPSAPPARGRGSGSARRRRRGGCSSERLDDAGGRIFRGGWAACKVAGAVADAVVPGAAAAGCCLSRGLLLLASDVSVVHLN